MATTGADFSTQATGYQTDQKFWGRACSLIVSSASGKSYDLSALRVKFRVVSKTVNTLKFAEITVYNLSPHTTQTLFSLTEFTQVSLSAGYQSGLFGLIFKGKIAYLKTGKEDALTSFLTIIASDSDDAYSFATINVSMKAGATLRTQLDEVLKKLAPYGVTEGVIAELPTAALPRGKVLYGKVTSVLDDLAKAAGCWWSFANGKLNLLKPNQYLPGDVVVLTPQTGLIGAPEQTLDGLNARSLLNPLLFPGRQIQVKSSLVTSTTYGSPGSGTLPDLSAPPLLPTLAANGLYVVYSLAHVGDTRGTGNDWLSEIVAVNPSSLPVSDTYLNAVVAGA